MKQKYKQLIAAIVLFLGFSSMLSGTVFAVSERAFEDILCSTSDIRKSPAREDSCRVDARDGTLSKAWHGKVIKYDDWKDKSRDALLKHIGETKDPSKPTPPGDEGDDESATPCSETIVLDVGCGSASATNPLWTVVLLVINVMAAGVAVLTIAGIVYGAIKYTTAGDKSDAVAQAQSIITNAVIGLIAFILMFSFLQFIIPGGVFNRNFDVPKPEPRKVDNSQNGDGNGGENGGAGGGGSGGENGSEDPPRQSDIKLANFRDAAMSTGGTVLQKHKLYRSAHLGFLRTNPEGRQKLAAILGDNTLIIDLRLGEDVEKEPDAIIPDTNYRHIPIDNIREHGEMIRVQKQREKVGITLRAIANAPGDVLVHCWSGKDRTGFIIELIMYINGATNEEVMREYLRSNAEYGKTVVYPNWLTDGTSAARARYGSMMKYIKATGVTDAEIKKIRQKFGA